MSGYNESYSRTPFNRLTKRYSGYDDVYDDLDTRIVERIISKEIQDIRYNYKNDLFRVKILDPQDKIHNPSCPDFAMMRLFSDLMGVNNISKLFIESDKIDRKNGNSKNVDYLNKVFRSLFRGKNKAEKVICHNVFDIWSEEGQGRTFVSGEYEYFSDIEFLNITNEFALEHNMVFVGAECTPLYTRANFIAPREHIIESISEPMNIGVSITNSEFKSSAVNIESMMWFPDRDSYLRGTSKKLSIGIPHNKYIVRQFRTKELIKNTDNFAKVVSKSMKSILNKAEHFPEVFQYANQTEAIEIDIDRESLQKALGIKKYKTLDFIIECVEEHGYVSNIFGVFFALTKYASTEADYGSERDSINKNAINILENPENFYRKIEREVSEEDMLVIPADNTEKKQQSLDDDFGIEIEID